MTGIQVASDLHIEYNEESDFPDPLKYINPSADILILAGDIGSLYRLQQLRFFLGELCKKFQIVLYIPGNHEWYALPNHEAIPLRQLEKRMATLGRSIENLYILDRSSVRIGNLCIAGATLWSNPKCKVPPFIVRVSELRTKEYAKRHAEDLVYLSKMINHCHSHGYKLVVVTHHPPSMRVTQDTGRRKKFQSLYATDLEYLLDKSKVDTWICGHVHKNFDFLSENGTRVLGNQKGKPKDRICDYSKEFVVSL
jgi:predicted phosphohydrolase